MSKLSLSNCQLESIDVSIKACSELKELRLAHNDIKTLPNELAHNTKLQNLDLGNNLISRLSDLKVLSSLQHLKNLNLQGNPIAENDKLMKKIRNLVPSIQIFNSKPIEKYSKNEQDNKVMELEKVENMEGHDDKKKHPSMEESKEVAVSGGDASNGKRKKEKRKKMEEGEEEKDGLEAGKKGLKVIDDRDTPFWELVASDTTAVVVDDSKRRQDLDSVSSIVMDKVMKKKKKMKASATLQPQVSQATVIGAGGPSAWDDDE